MESNAATGTLKLVRPPARNYTARSYHPHPLAEELVDYPPARILACEYCGAAFPLADYATGELDINRCPSCNRSHLDA